MDSLDHAIEDDAGKKLGGGVTACELWGLIEITKVQCTKRGVHGLEGAADVDDDAVGIELRTPEFNVDDVGGTVETGQARTRHR